MLVIRDEQMRVFEDAAWTAFLRSVLARARGEAPEAIPAGGDDERLELLRRSTADARANGFLLPADLRRFCLLVLRLGRDPRDDPALAPILLDPELLGAAKLDALEARAEVAWRS